MRNYTPDCFLNALIATDKFSGYLLPKWKYFKNLDTINKTFEEK